MDTKKVYRAQKTSSRPSRTRKRSFHGNRFTDEGSTSNTSSSAAKLKKSNDPSFDVEVHNTGGYSFIHFFSVFSMLSQWAVCSVCHVQMKFSQYGMRGLGFKVCVTCGCGDRYIDSCPMIGHGYEINRRLVFVFRMLGIGLQGIQLFCGLMELQTTFNIRIYYEIVDNIKIAVKSVFDLVQRKAIDEEKTLNVEKGLGENVTVSGDGSWAKRGFTSLTGIVSLIGKHSKKILDVAVMSSYCGACAYRKKITDAIGFAAWYEKHKDNCSANHEGSAGKMEVQGVVKMFLRSEEKYAVRYGFYIGDGDSKTFKMLLNTHPYGEDFVVKKLECVLHVAKRIFKRASDAKKILTQRRKAGSAELKDGEKKTKKVAAPKKVVKKPKVVIKKVKTADLTIKLMKELSTNYSLAIQRNSNSVECMRNEIWAGYYHKISTDSKPQHTYCSDSWCKYKKAEANNALKNYKHPPALASDVQEVLKPIYEDLTKTELLERCLGGNTQNNNECFNSTVWAMAPKHVFNGKKIVKIACLTAACIFNEGFSPVLKIMEVMGITIGQTAMQFATMRDQHRIVRANRRSTEASKEGRIKKKG